VHNIGIIHRIVFTRYAVLSRPRRAEVTVTTDDMHDERHAERPVRLEKTEGFVVIDGVAYPARELVEALAQSGYSELKSVGDTLVLGRKRISPVFKSPQERAMASLCHGSLAYCCPLSKRCMDRDRALEILGLRPQDYELMKDESHHRFIDVSRGVGYHDDNASRRYPTSQSVNAPSVDVGFGSDDYRRDFDALDQAMQSRSSSEPVQDRRESWGPETRRDCYQSTLAQTPRDTSGSSAPDTKSQTSCPLRGSESTEGLGALFMQGELSPFSDDYRNSGNRTGFCFACGRTIDQGSRKCPYCGVSQ
jgi:hypothetical protein